MAIDGVGAGRIPPRIQAQIAGSSPGARSSPEALRAFAAQLAAMRQGGTAAAPQPAAPASEAPPAPARPAAAPPAVPVEAASDSGGLLRPGRVLDIRV